MDMRVLSRAFLVAFLLVAVTVTGRAAGVQVVGIVVDPAGTAIPGAKVELLSGGRVTASTVSTPAGTFRLADVAPANYEIRVTLAGFRQTRMTIAVGSKTPAPLTIKLLIGSITESVEVRAESPAPDSAKARSAPPPLPAAAPSAAPVSGVGSGSGVGSSVGGGFAGGVSGGTAGRVGYPAYQMVPDAESYAAIEENK